MKKQKQREDGQLDQAEDGAPRTNPDLGKGKSKARGIGKAHGQMKVAGGKKRPTY